MTATSIRISSETKDDLQRLKPDVGRTYDEVIAELVEHYGGGGGDD